jgi:hypothetical protein
MGEQTASATSTLSAFQATSAKKLAFFLQTNVRSKFCQKFSPKPTYLIA